jgi:DNA-binding NarL/FixJ family response regulator
MGDVVDLKPSSTHKVNPPSSVKQEHSQIVVVIDTVHNTDSPILQFMKYEAKSSYSKSTTKYVAEVVALVLDDIKFRNEIDLDAGLPKWKRLLKKLIGV